MGLLSLIQIFLFLFFGNKSLPQSILNSFELLVFRFFTILSQTHISLFFNAPFFIHTNDLTDPFSIIFIWI